MTLPNDNLDGVPITAAEAIPAPPQASRARRQLLIQGITWSAAYQIFDVVLSFASMLVLVRLIPPGDYGRAAAVVGVLGLLNLLNAHLFFEHALQLPEHEEPDWQLHWTVGFYIQAALSLVCHAIAALCWFASEYRPIAPLLHIAALGVLLEWPNQFRGAMLRRQLDLRRLRIVASMGMTARLATTTALALAGFGAYAIVIGNNVVPSAPFTLDLLVVQGWRPRSGWWRWPSWRAYEAAATFGLQRASSNVIGGIRGAVESAVLPVPLGFAAMGLLNRAQALYGTTLGRVGSVLVDVVYPFLPRESHNRARYAVHATMYLQVMMFIALPGALFVGQNGPILSRVLYGSKWVAMDPLIWPGALIGLAGAALMVTTGILMAAGLIKTCVILEAVGAGVAVPALIVASVTRSSVSYSWVLAAAELVVALVAFERTSHLLQRGWWKTAVLPSLAAALAGLAAVELLRVQPISAKPLMQLVIVTAVFGGVALATVRALFSSSLDGLLERLPAGEHVRRLLLLHAKREPPPHAPPAGVPLEEPSDS